MPFVRVATNLSRNQLPRDFMSKLNGFLAGMMEKDPTKFKWQLETDKAVGQVLPHVLTGGSFTFVSTYPQGFSSHLWH